MYFKTMKVVIPNILYYLLLIIGLDCLKDYSEKRGVILIYIFIVYKQVSNTY